MRFLFYYITICLFIFISHVSLGAYVGQIVFVSKEKANYSTPEDSISAFFSANIATDLDWYYQTLTSQSSLQEKEDLDKNEVDAIAGLNAFRDAFSSASIVKKFEYFEAVVVLVKIVNISGDSIELPYTLIEEEGEWKVSNKYASSEELAKYVKYDLKLFFGKGQRPADVNSFLGYYVPKGSTTSLAPGENTFDLHVFYGSSISPSSFSASLNGKDIGANFSPIPSENQVVTLNLERGRNVLLLSVEGKRTDGKLARDEDRLVFIVP